jgi:hypothetical protein
MRSESRPLRAFTYMNKSCMCPLASVQETAARTFWLHRHRKLQVGGRADGIGRRRI